MAWFRGRMRWGGVAALFALAIQFVLSFGHLHVGALNGSPAVLAALAQAGDPPGHDDDHAHRVCSICATLGALNTAQPATPPTLAAPAAFAHGPIGINDNRVVATVHRTAFRSRAPPAA